MVQVNKKNVDNVQVKLSLGYTSPNLDKNYLHIYYQAYHNNATYTGPFSVAVNYRFTKGSGGEILFALM